MQGGCGKEQNHLPSFPIFLTQCLACTTQILQAAGVFLGLHREVGRAWAALEACPAPQLAREGDVSPQNLHSPLVCAEGTQQPSPGAGMVQVTLKDKAVPVTTHQEETEISSSKFFFLLLISF